jgi:hypothetical protein
MAQNFVEAIGELGAVTGAQSRNDGRQLVVTEHQVELVGLDFRRHRRRGVLASAHVRQWV